MSYYVYTKTLCTLLFFYTYYTTCSYSSRLCKPQVGHRHPLPRGIIIHTHICHIYYARNMLVVLYLYYIYSYTLIYIIHIIVLYAFMLPLLIRYYSVICILYYFMLHSLIMYNRSLSLWTSSTDLTSAAWWTSSFSSSTLG